MKKKNNGPHTFDDGLLINFKLSKPKHLSFYCRTSTPDKDACNLKLFKINEKSVTRTTDEKKWKPPISRNETVLFFRMGYFKYVKVNYEINDNLDVR